MMKLLIADDEELSREGLAQMPIWKDMGFELVAQASDGEEALALLRRCAIDVIVSDIRMPFLDGLAMASRALRLYPEIYIIFISGYDDFAYVRKAVQLGAFDYLLKPIQTQDLHEILQRLKDDYAGKVGQKGEMQSLRAVQQKYNRQLLFRKALFGSIAAHEAQELILQCQMHAQCTWFGVLFVQADRFFTKTKNLNEQQMRALQESMVCTLESIVGNRAEILFHTEGEYWIVLMDTQREIQSLCQNIGRRIVAQVKNEFFSITVALGGICADILQLKNLYICANEVMNLKFTQGDGVLITGVAPKQDDTHQQIPKTRRL